MTKNNKLAKKLILDELFDLMLYKKLSSLKSGFRPVLEELIPVENKHFNFWSDFFEFKGAKLNAGRRIKLLLVLVFCRVLGDRGIHLTLEATEIYGIKKYLDAWEKYKDDELGKKIKDVLIDEFHHEDQIVGHADSRKINPERVRNIFFGLNDGLVEMIGSVSGFFAALGAAQAVFLAGLTVAVAGSISMAAGAFMGANSEAEMKSIESGKRKFLNESQKQPYQDEPWMSGAIVGIAYFVGALIPVLPVVLGAKNFIPPFIFGGIALIAVSSILAFVSGMNIKKRIAMNIVLMVGAVAVTYIIGTLAKNLLGINI